VLVPDTKKTPKTKKPPANRTLTGGCPEKGGVKRIAYS